MSIKPLRIAMSSPELISLQRAMRGEATNATYIIQRQIANRLRDRGHLLTFISENAPGENVCTNDLDEPRPAQLTWSGSWWFNLVRKIVWRVQRMLGIPYLSFFSNLRLFDACVHGLPGHDLVYERNGLYRNGVAMACKYLNMPYVLYVEADEILEHEYMGMPITGLLKWRAKRLFKYNLDTANYVVCVSEPLRSHLVKNWNVSNDKVFVFPNGVDAQQFQPLPVEGRQIRESLDMGANPLILFVGNFYVWHDVPCLLDAFAQVLISFPEARLILVGDGAMRGSMEAYAEKLGIKKAVFFTGLLPHNMVPQYAAAVDVAVVPYPAIQHDLWLSPLKLFEYMASGKAIVASAIGQLVDIARDGENSLLVPPGDVPALVVALKRLINDPGLREKLGRQAREDAIHKHSWERYISRLEDLFALAINNRLLDHNLN